MRPKRLKASFHFFVSAMILLIATGRLDAQSPSPPFIHLYKAALEKGLQKNDLSAVAAYHAWNVKQLPFDNELFRFRELPTVDVALMPHVPVNDDASFELAALNRMMEATVSQHDAVAWTLSYADVACFLASDGQYYSGKRAIQKYLLDHAAGMPVFEQLDIRNDQIDDPGNGYVIEYASHIANWRYDAHSGIGLGKDFRIWKRQANGTLKILTHIGSYD